MKQVPLDSSMKSSPVAVTTIIAAVTKADTTSALKTPTTKVNTQVAGIAPDASGKKMTQFEALIGNYDAAFPTSYEAERFCIESARTAGCSNYTLIAKTATSYSILAW